jgi:signal transduction histidine kinase
MTFALQSPGGVFTAETVPFATSGQVDGFEVGSLLRFRGICLSETDQHGAPAGFKLLLPSLDWVSVIQRAPFWNTQRLATALAVVLAVLLVVAAWAILATRRSAAMLSQLRERNAVSAERTRLAQELHDSLQQSLIGIDLQIANAAHDLHLSPLSAQEHLGSARDLVKHSHRELRESIWMLRSVAGQPFDLAAALERSARMLFAGSDVCLEFELVPLPQTIPSTIEKPLFRIGQEALTNAFKHARATRLSLTLAATEQQLRLEIHDNGAGFEPPSPDAGSRHFGLQNMRERAARIGAELVIESGISPGTQVRITVPLQNRPTNSALLVRA